MQVKLLGEVAMLAQLHDHVHVVWRLESVHKLENIAVVELAHNLGLCHSISHLAIVNQLFLRHRLHRINHPRRLFLHLEYFAERPFS